MILTSNAVLYKQFIEYIIEQYFKECSNAYPNGCKVDLEIENGEIVAKITSNEFNIKSTTTWACNGFDH